MKRDQVLTILRRNLECLRSEYGVKSLALFGSVARDEAGPESDVDLLVEFNRPTGYFGLFQLQDHLSGLLGCAVDLGTPGSIKERMRSQVFSECIHVLRV
jgi:predicted nucleotidyltransferase